MSLIRRFRFNFIEGRPAAHFDTFPKAILTVFQVKPYLKLLLTRFHLWPLTSCLRFVLFWRGFILDLWLYVSVLFWRGFIFDLWHYVSVLFWRGLIFDLWLYIFVMTCDRLWLGKTGTRWCTTESKLMEVLTGSVYRSPSSS